MESTSTLSTKTTLEVSPIQNQTVKAMAGTIRAMCLEVVGTKDPTSQWSTPLRFKATPGLYVVIGSSDPKDTLVPYFNTVKHFVPDAYMKTSSVYIGCVY
jgi:hypothetical protein